MSAWRVGLEARGLGSVSINVSITAVRKLAVEAADTGLLAPELAAGDFSPLGTTIYNSYSTATAANRAVTRNPFPNTVIPQSLLDPVAGRIVALLPTPIAGKAINNYVYNGTRAQQTDQFHIRLNQNLGASDRLLFRYGYDNSTQVTPGIIPSPANAGVPIGPTFRLTLKELRRHF